MTANDPAITMIADAMRHCPCCGGCHSVYAFNCIHEPAGRYDGTYALCQDCRVHWPLIHEFVFPIGNRRKAIAFTARVLSKTKPWTGASGRAQ